MEKKAKKKKVPAGAFEKLLLFVLAQFYYSLSLCSAVLLI